MFYKDTPGKDYLAIISENLSKKLEPSNSFCKHLNVVLQIYQDRLFTASIKLKGSIVDVSTNATSTEIEFSSASDLLLTLFQ